MLKKLATYISAIIILAGCYFANSNPMFSDYAEDFEVYGQYKSSGSITAVDVRAFCLQFNRYGESVRLDLEKSDVTVQSVLDSFNAKIVRQEDMDGETIFYAYSPDIKYTEKVGDKKVNLHIAVKENERMVIGSPLIYGSF